MRQDVKEFADVMQDGWRKIPQNTRGSTTRIHHSTGQVVALCPLAHAFLGSEGHNLHSVFDEECCEWVNNKFPILNTQQIDNPRGGCGGRYTLFDAIIELSDLHHWTTPEIISWLRTHQND